MSISADFHATSASFCPATYFLEVIIDTNQLPPWTQIATLACRPVDLVIQVVTAPVLSAFCTVKTLRHLKKKNKSHLFAKACCLSPFTIGVHIAERSVICSIEQLATPLFTIYALREGKEFSKTFLAAHDQMQKGGFRGAKGKSRAIVLLPKYYPQPYIDQREWENFSKERFRKISGKKKYLLASLVPTDHF